MSPKSTSTSVKEQTTKLIDGLVECNALKTDKDYTLKSKRESPYFLNIGDVKTGAITAALANSYADTIAGVIKEHKDEWKDIIIYGIPEKGVAFAATVTTALAQNYNIDVGWFFTRKFEKTYGEATNLPKSELAKSMIVGKVPTSESAIIMLDDVLTTADAKYTAIKDLNILLDKPKIVALAIAADRQEVGINGKSAAEEFSNATGIPVYFSFNATEVRRHLAGKTGYEQKGVSRMANYMRVYGTREARDAVVTDAEKDMADLRSRVGGTEEGKNLILGNNSGKIVLLDRSVIPACDVIDIQHFVDIASGVSNVEGIGGLKIGFSLGLTYGLPEIVARARACTTLPIIYDHQKAGTDVTDTGSTFMRVVKKAGVDAVILFPQSGPETERAWIYRALDNDLKVIVGGIMTHPAYLVSEGGFIQDSAAFDMYRIAARAGVRNFVVPGTKPEIIKAVKEVVESEGVNPIWYVPGMVTQGGTFAEVTAALGKNWNAIVGRAITNAKDYKTAAEDQVKQLLR